MGDRFHQISMEALTDGMFDELDQKDQFFGVPGRRLGVRRRSKGLSHP